MGGASRFIALISTVPLSLLHPRPSLLRLSLLLRRRSSLPFLRPLSSSSHHQFHSHPLQHDQFAPSQNNNPPPPPPLPLSHPWPEWSKFIDSLCSQGGGEIRPKFDDGFVAYEELSQGFVRASEACLAFARQRPDLLRRLSRKDIGVVVEKGTPFLFTSALDTARRMRAFLGAGGVNEFESDKAHTVDLMKYLLSYASNPTIPSDRDGDLFGGDLLESSVRNLLSELSRLSSGTSEPDLSMAYNFADRYVQNPRPLGPKIEMKRGDWICSKCSFMNFARNMKCLECEESRPKRQLTGGEWECPQCDFFNYGRNQVCLRCDCKRPGEASFGTSTNNPELESRLAANEEKAQRWFSKISQMDSASDLSNAAAGEDFPEIMPLRKGENKFVVSTRKTALERRLANSKYQRNLNEGSVDSNSTGNSSKHVPFVPLPSDMFAKKPQEDSKIEDCENADIGSFSPKSTGIASTESEKSFKSVSLNQKQDEKPERWFKKVAELHDIEDLSTISNEDFPEIMPKREGENRFVVSKKKDRSLTSPMYKRKVATEQAANTNFVPFVPFPPDYFAKKDKGSNTSSDPTSVAKTENYSSPVVEPDENSIVNPNPIIGNRQMGMESAKEQTNFTGKSLEGSAVQELDPLDMSEEAKAQRWFRRVAQIKDISELSQIPDEDFPSIMPMRKGVNRFVVSKRKTPLERRLTSPQYKRNLPVVSSDPLKRENENS